jgi:hypothetical protein
MRNLHDLSFTLGMMMTQRRNSRADVSHTSSEPSRNPEDSAYAGPGAQIDLTMTLTEPREKNSLKGGLRPSPGPQNLK